MPRLRLVLLAALVGLFVLPAAPGLAAGNAPVNSKKPSIDSGRPQSGSTLGVTNGTWTGDLPITYTYQWQRCDSAGANCVNISGQTGSTYTATSSDQGMTLVAKVTATNAAGTGTATTDPTIAIPTFSLSTAHFVVHYQSDATVTSAITETQAGDIAALAERAYAAETGYGYPAPPSDSGLGGDNRVDIYVGKLPTGTAGLTVPDGSPPSTSSYIVIDPTTGLNQHVIAHELFHTIQLGIWYPSSVSDYWLLEGSAEWMGYKVDGFPSDSLVLGPWDMAIDCRDPLGTYQCDLTDDYHNNGYSRWTFFEYLAERYGDSIVKDVFSAGASANSATTGVTNVLSSKGTTLAAAYEDFAAHLLSGNFTPPALQTIVPPAYVTVETGTLASGNATTKAGATLVKTVTLPTTTVDVNHLSTRFVELERGSTNAPDGPCFSATLSLNVALPSGVSTQPYFWWSQANSDGTKQAVQALSISGSNATITLPWDTCQWGSVGMLALPNATQTLDAQDFKITGTLAIDTTKIATSAVPPAAVVMPGAAANVSSTDGVPSVSLFGPAVVHVSTDDSQLRLAVSSSAGGTLRVALGSTQLGTAALRAGTNDVRLSLPASLPAAGTTQTLTLTPLSPSGGAGTALTRQLVIDSAASATAKGAKTKTKTKAKARAKAKAKARTAAKRRVRRR